MPENFRPICVVYFLSKSIENSIVRRLTQYLRKFNVILSYEVEFRPEFSTDLALISLTDHLKLASDEWSYTGSIFIDLTI